MALLPFSSPNWRRPDLRAGRGVERAHGARWCRSYRPGRRRRPAARRAARSGCCRAPIDAATPGRARLPSATWPIDLDALPPDCAHSVLTAGVGSAIGSAAVAGIDRDVDSRWPAPRRGCRAPASWSCLLEHAAAARRRARPRRRTASLSRHPLHRVNPSLTAVGGAEAMRWRRPPGCRRSATARARMESGTCLSAAISANSCAGLRLSCPA